MIQDIFFAADHKFAQHLCVTITSLLVNALPETQIRIYVLTRDLGADAVENLEGLKKIREYSLEILKISAGRFDHLHSPTVKSQATFYRFLIPTIKPNLEKVLYLDCDLVIRSPLDELFNTPLDDFYCAGVEDINPKWSELKLRHYFKTDQPYLNAGVLLFNCKKLREDHLDERFFDLADKLNQRTYFGTDQDVINIATQDAKLLLDVKFNVTMDIHNPKIISTYSDAALNNAALHPVIVHFTGPAKPWKLKYFPVNDFAFEYFKYLKLTPYFKRTIYFTLLFRNGALRYARKQIRLNPFIIMIYHACLLPWQLILYLTAFLKYPALVLRLNRMIKVNTDSGAVGRPILKSTTPPRKNSSNH